MLSIAKVGRGRQAYYLATVPSGRGHDSGLVEPDGEWAGSAAAALGLAGVVDPARLGWLLAGSDPSTGEVLSPSHRRVRVAAYDCTFSTPKSVSVLHALGPDDAVAAVREAHSAAVRATLGYLERTAVQVRRSLGRGAGRCTVAGNGFAAAGFLHRSSRAPDPHLHTHLLVANCVPGPDGRWSALDARELFVQAPTASHCYEAQLRREIGRRLGLRFGPMRGGSAELEGFDQKLLRGFSRRSTEIAERLEARGWSGPRARRIAALATRSPKDLSVTYEALQERWWDQSAELGMPCGHLVRLVDAGRERVEVGLAPAPAVAGAGLSASPAVVSAVVEAAGERVVGPTGLTERAASFSRCDVVRALCREAGDGATVGEIEQRADEILASTFVVPRDGTVPRLRLGAGGSFPGSSVVERYTTLEILALERSLVERAAGAGGQVEMLVLPAGGAGTSVPTDALDGARAGWRAAGIAVAGVAPTLRAAQRWEALSGIETVPLDALGRGAGAVRDGAGAMAGGVLVVGSAGRVDPRRLDALVEGAGESGTKLVLVVEGRLRGPMAELARAGLAGAGAGAPAEPGHSWSTPSAGKDPERAGGGAPAEPGRSWSTPSAANDPERAAVAGTAGAGADWRDAGGIRVGLVPSAQAAREAASEECRRRQTEGRQVVLVAPDRATARSLQDAGVRTTVPREAGAVLDADPATELVVIGPAAALPSGVRRRADVDRTHLVVQGPADGVDGRLAEAALPPRLVREIGTPPRSREGRDAWRRTASLVVERETARSVTTDVDLATARRDLDRCRRPGRDRGLDYSLGR